MHHKYLYLLAHPRYISVRLTPIHLRILPGLKFQGEKHFRRVVSCFPGRNLLPDSRFTALVSLFSDQFKDPMSGVALLAG
jgi:hypothetical protein